MNKNNTGLTEEAMFERGLLPLSTKEIEKKIIGKTIKGDWGNVRKYVCYMDHCGVAEGKNDIGTHSVGKWTINIMDHTFSVEWDSYWANWTGRVYDVEGKIVMFDSQSHKMRTLIHTIEDGRRELKF